MSNDKLEKAKRYLELAQELEEALDFKVELYREKLKNDIERLKKYAAFCKKESKRKVKWKS